MPPISGGAALREILDTVSNFLRAVLKAAALILNMYVKRRAPAHVSHGRSFWLDMLLPMSIQKDVQANLEEMMTIWIEAHGVRRARRIRRSQIFLIIAGHYATPFWNLLVKVAEVVRGR